MLSPRRTPPRETTNSRVEASSNTIPHAKIDDTEINDEIHESSNKEPVATFEMSCQVNEQELKCNLPDPGPHPLRVLSEENLTIVSSFAGSTEKLEDVIESELRNDEIDPSKLSFFKVPDFNADFNPAAHVNEDTIAQTFKDFEAMHNNVGVVNKPEKALIERFQDPRYDRVKENQNHLKTFSKCEVITPQKQFLLLSQSLRHPDGSSNPELNVVQGEREIKGHRADATQVIERSPGNGKSDTEQEDNGNHIVTSPSGNNNIVMIENQNKQNQNKKVEEEKQILQEQTTQKKSKFGFKFFRLFGSQRAKSCDRTKVQKLKSSEQIKSASSSPVIKKSADPSTLSISTEWEFEAQDEDNGNSLIDKVKQILFLQ